MKEVIKRISDIGIVPVVKINKEEDSIPVANALLNGGIDCMEITFRSKHTISAIRTISNEFPEILIGAGTVASTEQAKKAIEAGAKFIVTPGLNIPVIEWCIENKVLIVPGVGTPSEIETALSYGLTHLKLFPAATMGGDRFIKDMSGPYSQVKFMPTGGINSSNMHNYLKLKNVIAVGGSFMLQQDLIDSKNWNELESLVRKAVIEMLDIRLTSFENDLDNIVLTTPYLDRTYYHLNKHIKGILFEKDNLNYINNNGTLMRVYERGKL